ncbi:MAG TPA: DNA polymerase III subunit chi [Beijerinckiaceae bacterium]|nr:DNA polymerase III subunit chi [Beijerinckiaceae bacterium]
MSEILFYHLQSRPLDQSLPLLIEKSRARGWKVVLRAGSDERLQALDDLLWTFADDSFIAHGTAADGDPASQPVLLTTKDERPNQAEVLFLVDHAPLPADYPYERVVVMFDGNDPEALDRARADWKAVKALGHAATYWQQDEAGRWIKRS